MNTPSNVWSTSAISARTFYQMDKPYLKLSIELQKPALPSVGSTEYCGPAPTSELGRRCEYTTQWSDLSSYMAVKPGQSAYLMFQLYKSVRIGVCRILLIRWPLVTSNHDVRLCCNIQSLNLHLRRRRLRWLGHVLRSPTTDFKRKVLAPQQCRGWRHRHGGQLKTWLTTIKQDVDVLGLSSVYGLRNWNANWINIVSELASDRRQWSVTVRDIVQSSSSINGVS